MGKTILDVKFNELKSDEPIFKMKGGVFQRADLGWTSNVIFAKMFSKEELKTCFDVDGENGYHGSFAVPVEQALDINSITKKSIIEFKERIVILERFAR